MRMMFLFYVAVQSMIAGCNRDFQFKMVIGPLSLQAQTVAGALIEIGQLTNTCIAIPHLDAALAARTKTWRIPAGSFSDALEVLGVPRSSYDITIGGGVLMIAAKKYLPSQQDETIADYTIETGPLQEASFGVFNRLISKNFPTTGGIAVTIHRNNRNNMVGPLQLIDKPAREILGALIGQSTGAAWVGWHGPPASHSTEQTWTIFDYQQSESDLASWVDSEVSSHAKDVEVADAGQH